ncbi:TIGR03936 family radical SAM-associated protein [Colibacter massiliensis]|uniref:TIGR03936 family radical SAM-associated protein n=1 Tax=Colibacter massiliensis TaxID=1852379 RepID=UPI00235408A7|nr:TIGR03936 family radical SAM-associated protein [Colibacter massiliensis]
MARLRLVIKKTGSLQFLSHLDFAGTVRYIVMRADLPVLYSEGFNPHMKISFASALGVGVGADEEYMDLELAEEVPLGEVMVRMNSTSPSGFAVLGGKYMDAKAPKLMAVANYAVYILCGPLTAAVNDEELAALLKRFNEATEVFYEKYSPKTKKTRRIDVKEHLIEDVKGRINGENLELTVPIYQTEAGAIKPIQVWEILAKDFALPVDKELMLARRTALRHREQGVNRSLLEE